jgi:HEAT repeat protein
MDDLLLALTSGDDERAEDAARRLAAHGEAAIPALRSLLAAPQAETRWWAARALAEIPGGWAAPWSIEALRDPDIAVRQCAALGISRQPDEQAVPALVEAMSSDDALLARLAANALASIGEAAVPALLDLLENGPQPVRLEAARALAMIGDTRAIPALFNALDGDSALLEYWANEGLERMGVGMMFFKP